MAVLCSAAARGWRLADVLEAVRSGAWKAFPALYERRSEPGRMDRLLPLEWRKAVGRVGGQENVRRWLTSDISPRPPADTGGPSAEYGFIRQWVTGTDCAAEDPERIRRWGRRAIAIRQLLAAIGQAAMVSGSSVIEFGTRNLSLHSGLSQRTVSRLLRLLREEPDPLIDLVSRRRAARADRYQLRIPDAYADSVRWRRRRAGRIEAVHPAFLVLGGAAALTYQVLDANLVRGAEVARMARLLASAVAAALRVLAEHGLAGHGPGGWRRGDVALDDIAAATGAATCSENVKPATSRTGKAGGPGSGSMPACAAGRSRLATVSGRWTMRTNGRPSSSAAGRFTVTTSCAGHPRPRRGRARGHGGKGSPDVRHWQAASGYSRSLR
jgi:hypothetical protein